MKRFKQITSFILIVLLLSSLLAPVLAEKAGGRTIHIKTKEDLYNFAKKASFDKYSLGLTVILENDIDLKGENFTPIPIFKGTFDGRGHTIKGVKLEVEGSNQGFFRYLEEEGVIKNLTIEGSIMPKGDQKNIGGLVGFNKGTIDKAHFKGILRGKNTIGGIAGYNSTSGKIINSSSDSFIYGERKVGGIAGVNAGVILRGHNKGHINTTVEETSIDLQELVDEELSYSKIFTDATDIGGIVGANTGVIKGAENHGTIGYPSVGYNIGGIAGRQSGYIDSCTNYGKVLGRKDVAGVVGQIEPNVKMTIPPNRLTDLNNELNKLQDIINKLNNNFKISSQAIGKDLKSVQEDMDRARGHIKVLIDYTEGIIDEGLEGIDEINILVVEILDRLIPINESLENILDEIMEAIGPLDQLIKDLVDSLENRPDIREDMEELGELLSQLGGHTSSLRKGLADLQDKLGKAIDMIQAGNIIGALELINSMDTASVLETIEAIMDNLNQTSKILNRLMEFYGDSEELRKGLEIISKVMEVLGDSTEEFKDISKALKEIMELIKDFDGPNFETPGDTFLQAKDGLFESIEDVSNSLGQFLENMDKQGRLLMDSMEEMSNQLLRVVNLMFDILDEIFNREVQLDRIVEDVSTTRIDQVKEGKVYNTRNYGTIEADRNVGGIAGAMSIDLELDPEDDIDISGRFTANTIFESRAVIDKAENYGDIVGKKNHVGGIVGNMDLGFIRDVISSAKVESTAGNYVGGIAGKSMGPIYSSYSRSSLKGGNYIGGISGLAKEIQKSYSLVDIEEGKAYLGAIAGRLDETNRLKDNYFASDKLSGIDGISYENKAEPIAYDKLINIEGIPSVFKKFKLSFWIEDELVDSYEFNYGDDLTDIDLPSIPEKEGYYGQWEDLDFSNLKFDQDIQAEYKPFISILESEELRDETLAKVLVEGQFVEGDSLRLKEDDDGLVVEIPEDGNQSHTIRYIPEDENKKYNVFVEKDGKWSKVRHKQDGKYLVFKADGYRVKFKAEWAKRSFKLIYIGLTLIGLIIVGFYILRRYLEKKNAVNLEELIK